MMTLPELITPTTVVKAAQFILKLDLSKIHEDEYSNISAARYWLQDSLTHYLQPRVEVSFNGFSSIEHLEYTLKTLLESVKSLLPCLNEQTKLQLYRFLVSQKIARDERKYA